MLFDSLFLALFLSFVPLFLDEVFNSLEVLLSICPSRSALLEIDVVVIVFLRLEMLFLVLYFLKNQSCHLQNTASLAVGPAHFGIFRLGIEVHLRLH